LGFPDAELSITLTTDAEIAELAGSFGREPSPTDVLSFPAREGPGARFAGELLGDVVISLERAEWQAARRDAALDTELRDLLIHGILHLVGMDHERPAEARAMRELEDHLRWEIARTR
jgi:probable rRNA maturation factor